MGESSTLEGKGTVSSEKRQYPIVVTCQFMLINERTLYSYIPVEVADGVATSTFIPSQYLGEPAVRGASGSAKASRERLTCGLFRLATSFEEGGHFVVYFPKQARKNFLNAGERHALLSDLEAVYDEYLNKGYAYKKREEWPMEVYIQSLEKPGYYFYRWNGADGQIYLNRDLFKDGYKANKIKPLLAHEFFHFVQLNYVESGSDLLWFDEATATYFEGQKAGDYPSIVREHEELVFSGVLENDAVNGYARMPLIKFLSQKRGEKFILNAYTIAGGGAGWEEALLSSAGPPSVWAGDFYEALIRGEVSHFSAYMLHNALVGKKGFSEEEGKKGKSGTKLELTIPKAEEIDAMVAKGEEPVFGSATVSVGSFGAQLVAITVDEKNLSRLPEGIDPSVSVSGGDFRVFVIRGGSVVEVLSGGGAVTLKDFKKLSNDFSEKERNKTLFLVLVIGLHKSGKQDYTVKVGLPAYPTLDELVGEYPAAYGGSLRVYTLRLAGLSLYGGIFCSLAVLLSWARATRADAWRLLDALVLPTGLAFALARVGCYLNGCCAGIATSSRWGVPFPLPKNGQELFSEIFPLLLKGCTTVSLYPTQLFELALALLGLIPVPWFYFRRRLPRGAAFLLYGVWFSSMRLVVLPLRSLLYAEIVVNYLYPMFYIGLILCGVFLLTQLYKKQS